MISPTVDSTNTRPIRRILLTAGGLIFFVVAIVGVWLPGIPTTGPLIMASMLLGKANPALRERVLAMRVFAPYRGYVDGSKPFTRAARFWALGCMWISIAISCGILFTTAGKASIAIPMCVIGGVIGSVLIFWYQPKPNAAFVARENKTNETLSSSPALWRFDFPSTSEMWVGSQSQRGGRHTIKSIPR